MTKESPASLTPEERAAHLMVGRPLSPTDPAFFTFRKDIADALRAAEARGRERGIEEAARALENPTLPGDLPFVEAADVVRGLLSAEPQATPPSLPDSAEVATLRLDVAWWRARVEAVERERDNFATQAGDWQITANEQEQRAIAAEAYLDRLHDVLRGLAVSAVNGDYTREKLANRLIEESDRIDAFLPDTATPTAAPSKDLR